MTDVGWIYTLVQAGATFAAIVGAFFTTKILSIASEKRTLQNRIEQVQDEISRRTAQLDDLKSRIDNIRLERARDVLDLLEDELMAVVDLNHPPTREEMDELFEKAAKRPPNEYETKAMEDFYPNFIQKVNEKAKAEAAKRAEEAQRRRLEEQAKLGSIYAVAQLYATPYLPSIPRYGIPSLPSLRVSKDDLSWLEEAYWRYAEQKSSVDLLNANRVRLEEDLRTLSFPKYVRVGYLALVYLLTATVMVPLWLARDWSTLPSYSDTLMFVLFLSGMVFMSLYLYVEIRYAIAPPQHKER